jgi:hypothetical protein
MTNGRRNPRTNSPTKVPGIPKPPSDVPASLQRYLSNLGEALEIRLGRKGDVRDRAITLRELIESGLAVDLANNPYDPNRPGGDFGSDPGNGGGVETPIAPTNFTAIGAFSTIAISWDWPGYQYNGHSYTEIWRHDADVLSLAQLIGISPGRAYVDYVGGGGSFYYWARHVNVNSVEGPYNANAGTFAETQPDVTFLLDLLTDSITSSQLVQALRDPIALIPNLETFTGYTSTYNGDSLITRMGAVETVAGNAATSAQLQAEQTARVNADSALASDVLTIQTTVYNVDSNGDPDTTSPKISASAFNATVAEVFPNSNTATTSNISQLQTEVFEADGVTSRLAQNSVVSTISQDLDKVEQQYTVKLSQTSASGNTYITGYGLATEDVDGTPTSAFVVAADKFAVINPATYTGGQTNTPNATYMPFAVVTSGTTLQGESVPAGVYIDTAFINKGRVLDLIAGSVVADFVQATAAISSPNIYGGTFNIGSINYNSSTDPRDWTVSGSNRVSNFSVDANGIMHCEAAQLKAVTVLADDGTVLLDAGGTIVGGGANMIPNGQLYSGPSSPSTFVWGDENPNTEIIPFWEVADSNVGNTTGSYVSYWTSNFAGVVQLFYGSTFRMQEFLPCAEAEVYYLAVDNFMNNNSLQWSVAVQFSNSSKTFVTQTSLSPTSSLWDDPPVSYVQGVGSPTNGTRYSVAQITVPSNSNIRYMRVRFSGGSFTGTSNHYVNIKSVYLSKVPPVIGPKYASTYIRDLAVDTLQIAGNAVTVPIGQSNVNVGNWVTWSGTNSNTGTGFFWGTVANTGSVGGVTAIPLSWTSNDVRPDALTITACANFLGQSGSAWKTIRARIVYSTSPSFTSATQIQVVGASLRTDFSTTLSVNATLDASSLTANTNYYFALQMHGNDQGGTGPTPWKIGQNGISVLAAKK